MYRIPETIDFDAKRLISKILVLDPLKRPKASEIEQDRWVRAGKTTYSGNNNKDFSNLILFEKLI